MNQQYGAKKAEEGNGSTINLKTINWPTLILVLLTGGGNLIATNQNSKQRESDAYRAFSQVKDLHEALDEFEKRQKQTLERIDQSLSNQVEMLKNQHEILTQIQKQPPL